MDPVVTFYCVHCGVAKLPQKGPSQLDPRYTLGMCDGQLRQLIDDKDKALSLAMTTGKLKPKTKVGKLRKPRRTRL